MSSFFSRRRHSKSERDRHSHPPISNPQMQSPPSSYNATMLANGVTSAHHDSRPSSSAAMSDTSYDFATQQPQPPAHATSNPVSSHNPIANPTNSSHRYANAAPSSTGPAITSSSRPLSHGLPQPGTSGAGLGNLSRTDQVVLKYFWHAKAEENAQRDLHFLKFPIFGNTPGMRELIPFCEIYSLVKSSQGAKVVGLGTLGSSGSAHGGGGSFIGFELFANSQLHIDLDDSWDGISHYRVSFKPYESLIRDSSAEAAVRSWPKPLTIEFLEEQYARWREDLTAVCWLAREVSELGGGGGGGNVQQQQQQQQLGGGVGVGGIGGGAVQGGVLPQQGQTQRRGEEARLDDDDDDEEGLHSGI